MIDYHGIDLKSCPFCGVDDLVRLEPGNDDGTFIVQCNCCWAEGPFAHSPFEAASKWNNLKLGDDRN